MRSAHHAAPACQQDGIEDGIAECRPEFRGLRAFLKILKIGSFMPIFHEKWSKNSNFDLDPPYRLKGTQILMVIRYAYFMTIYSLFTFFKTLLTKGAEMLHGPLL